MTEPTSNETGTGPKTQDALDALDAAIAKVEAFHKDDDEQDAAPIWERVHQLEAKLAGAPSHAPKDALTGMPIAADGGANLGPADPLAGRTADPVVTPEESGQAASAPEGTPTLSEDAEPGRHTDANSDPR